jgi:DNA-binding HxlR family transcriptional regulator
MNKKTSSNKCCCPVYAILEILSKKWVMHILRTLCGKGKMRFTDIKEALPEINSRILSERLSDLENEKLLTRTVEQTKPITILYELTEKACDLKSVFSSVSTWAKKWEEK